MQLEHTPFEGCFEIRCMQFPDRRGSFVKTFHEGFFRANGLRCDWREEYYSVSVRHVLRGIHFQKPPQDHAKLVYCLAGSVLDVVVDLRKDSSTYGQVASFELSAAKANSLYLPSGLAHGFLSLSEQAIMQYKVTSVHSPEHDAGILWNSIGFDWPVTDPVISDRDRQHPSLRDFVSPFRMPRP